MNLVLDPVVDELADHPACNCPDRDRRKQRRREQADREPDPAAPAHPLATQVVARLPHRDTAVPCMRDENHTLDLELLLLDERDKRLEVARCLLDLLVARNEHVGRRLGHHDSPFGPESIQRQAGWSNRCRRLNGLCLTHVTL